MKLSDDVYLVGGGDYGFNLTHRLDCHTDVVDGDELVLIDAGFGPGTDQIVAAMRGDGLDPSRVARIVVTHYHADHAGGCVAMARATGAEVWAPAEAAETIRVADAERIGLTWAQSFGFYPADYRLEPCEVAHGYADGERIPAGELQLEAVATPGHCDGHYVLRLQGRDRA